MSNTLTIVKMWCNTCDDFTWHVRTSDGQYKCMPCWSRPLEDVLKDTFIIIAQ
ncbi:hypothetical protein ES703_46965 [subsurface metagenome]